MCFPRGETFLSILQIAAEKKRKAEEREARARQQQERRAAEDAEDRAAAQQRATELRSAVAYHREGQSFEFDSRKPYSMQYGCALRSLPRAGQRPGICCP